MFNNLIKELQKIDKLKIKTDQTLKDYTTFKVGGAADLFIVPSSTMALKKALNLIPNDLNIFILGAGSNVIVSDKGFRGIVIYLGHLNKIEVNDTTIIAQTGVKLSDLAESSLKEGLTGLEFASGIPGTLGGGLYMNAGAYGGELKEVIKETTFLNYQGEEIILTEDKLQLSYRHSILQEKDLIATRVNLKLKKGDKKAIKDKIDDLKDKRWTKQPMEMPSAGSIFKRPKDHYAGALIEKAGLKGTKVGDAQVSKKHAGFIVNLGDATAQDIRKLIKKVQQKVYQNSGVKLEVEPRFIGEF